MKGTLMAKGGMKKGWPMPKGGTKKPGGKKGC
jgi:hypothetical protein